MQSSSAQPARRFLTQELAQIEIFGKAGQILTKMANVSTTGAFFEIINASITPKKDDLVRITINLRAVKRTHIIDAQIVWCKGMGLGVEFLNRDEMNQKISQMLSRNQ